jgi:hypothetical protein
MIRGTPNGSKMTVMLKIAPMIIMTNPRTTAIRRPVRLMIQAKKRQIAQNGHKYQGTELAFVK